MLRIVLSSPLGIFLRIIVWIGLVGAIILSAVIANSQDLLSVDMRPLEELTHSRTSPINHSVFNSDAQPRSRQNTVKNQTLAALVRPVDPVLRQTISPQRNRHLTLLMVGDTGYAPSRAKPLADGVHKYGKWQTFAQTTELIKSEINGDINFANMESVISASTKLLPVRKKYNFVTHPNGAGHLVDIGFNLFSMANNHAFDYGQKGIRDSVKHVNELKNKGLLAHAGIGLDREQAADIALMKVSDMRIAFGAIGIGASGPQRATDKRPGQLSLYSKADLDLLTGNLRQTSSDLRLLSIHRGKERRIRPAAHEIQSVRNLVKNSQADVMIGHHAHVARGLEITDGALIVYGLGNFLHQGTANMNGKNGCQNYSLIIKAHFTSHGEAKPELAAIVALPIHSTHMQTRRLPAKQAARRIGVLNGLARQFDNIRSGSRGVRFMTQSDGSGLYCTNAARLHPETKNLCSNFSTAHIASDRHHARALSSCGRLSPKMMIAKAPDYVGPTLHIAVDNSISSDQKQILSAQTDVQLKAMYQASASELGTPACKPGQTQNAYVQHWQLRNSFDGNILTKTSTYQRWVASRYAISEIQKQSPVCIANPKPIIVGLN